MGVLDGELNILKWSVAMESGFKVVLGGEFLGFFLIRAATIDIEMIFAFDFCEGLKKGKYAFLTGKARVPDDLHRLANF